MPSPSAEQMDIKRRGRRRLIGALTLGLVAIVVLPMVFDAEPRREVAGKQEIAIQIPAKEGLPPLPPPTPAKPEPSPSIGANENATGKAGTELPPATTPTVAAPVVAPAPTPATRPVPDVPAREEPSSAVKPQKAPAKSASVATDSGGFVVLLGAYKDADNAKTLAARMKEAKMPVIIDTVAIKSGKVTRVRLGPYANKADAEAALAQVKLLGADGKIAALRR